jgi:molybdopterin converting factor small subunit
MIVRLRVFGELERPLGGERCELTVPIDATLAHLLVAIDERCGAQLSAELWDRAAQRFRGPVVILADGRDITAPATPLREGQVISLVPVISGG